MLDGIIPLSMINELKDDVGGTIAQKTEEWLEQNIDPATGYVLDNTLTLDNAAPPASAVGDLKSAVSNIENETLSKPFQFNWVHGGIDNATGQTNNNGSLTRSRDETYYAINDFISVKNSSSSLLWIIYYTFANDTYSFLSSESVSAGNSLQISNYKADYLRFDIRGSLDEAALVTGTVLSSAIVMDVDGIKNTVFPNINTSSFLWEIGGLGYSGESYDDRTTSIRTINYLNINKLDRIVFNDDFTTGYLCLYASAGSSNGFIVREKITSLRTIYSSMILKRYPTTTRFRIEIGSVNGDTSEYNLVSIYSNEDVEPSIHNYYFDTKKQEAKLMLLHKTGSESYGRCQFSAMIMSDIHNEKNRTRIIFKLMKDWGTSYFDAFINCGDTVATTNSTDLTWYNSEVSDLGVPYINVVGNHDAWSSLSVLASQSDTYSKIISPLAGQTGIVQPSDASTNSLCYYYFDLGTGVRVIALDCMYWDSDEATWLESVLSDAKTNSKSVICVSHYGFGSTNMTQIKSLWREVDISTANAINIVAAEKVKAFMDDGGEFICWIVGHTHGDNLHKLESHGNQLVVTLASAVQRAGYLQKSDDPKDYNYTLATYMTVDKYYKTVRFLRLGADIDTWGVKHNGLSLNYETKELIAAW